jgi:sugar (pentulose or hexulose) kinase
MLVGIDVGTSSVKAAAVGLDGAELRHAAVPTPWRSVPTGAEADPWALAEAALAAACEALGTRRALAVGVCSMAETGVLLDARGVPAAPAIAWHDTRGDEDERALREAIDFDEFVRHTGLPQRRLLSLVKLRGLLRAGVPGVRWLNVSEWVVRALGGDEAAELSLSSRTGFLEVERRAPWAEALAVAGAGVDLLPSIVPAGTPLGVATAEGIEGAALTVSGHDHLCAAVGAGATRDGDLFDSNGSAEALIAAVEPPVSSDDALRAVAGGATTGWHVFDGRRSLVGGFLCGLTLGNVLDLLGARDRRAELGRAALAEGAGAGGLRLADVAAPAATLSGIGLGASPARAWRAALEATQENAASIKQTIEAIAGPRARHVVAGGWAGDEAYLTVKRAHLGALERPPVVEAGARGAALLAGLAAGIYQSVDELPPPSRAREAVA